MSGEQKALHTPGPWQWLDDYRQLVGSTSKDNDVLARSDCGDLYVPHWGTGYANARLIAAAPDLLEALQDLFGADMEHVLMGDGKDDQIEAIAKGRAAIAKALGRST